MDHTVYFILDGVPIVLTYHEHKLKANIFNTDINFMAPPRDDKYLKCFMKAKKDNTIKIKFFDEKKCLLNVDLGCNCEDHTVTMSNLSFNTRERMAKEIKETKIHIDYKTLYEKSIEAYKFLAKLNAELLEEYDQLKKMYEELKNK